MSPKGMVSYLQPEKVFLGISDYCIEIPAIFFHKLHLQLNKDHHTIFFKKAK